MNVLIRYVLLTLLAVGAIASAGDQAATERQGAPASVATPAPSPTPTRAATPTPDPEKQLEEFVPSEEVRADQAVAFPVDI